MFGGPDIIHTVLLLVLAVTSPRPSFCDVTPDENGYVLYCPCMGRFGNQADHFLGSLAFAKGLNRTLVLPPWVEYPPGAVRSVQVPFDRYFAVEPLLQYHRVMTMERFMADLAPSLWPPGKRIVYCYAARKAIVSADDGGCNAKDGNPFGSFWDTFNVDFDASEYYGNLAYETDRPMVARQWAEKYPPSRHPVLAFTGAPAGFPVLASHALLHRYLVWGEGVRGKVEEFIRANVAPAQKWIGVHMRSGRDWTNVCVHTNDMADHRGHLFASAQCLGAAFEHAGRWLTRQGAGELCLPSRATVLRQVRDAVERTGATVVFVATDGDSMAGDIEGLFDGKVRVVQRLPADPHVDLATLALADHFIGNCVSTFSAFAVRERRGADRSVEFWAFNPPPHADEL